MIQIEKTNIVGFEDSIRGMRNPLNSWDKSDSGICKGGDNGIGCMKCSSFRCDHEYDGSFQIGNADYALMLKLAKAGSVHAKYRRMIHVYVDVTAPLYWWKEFDTYKVGTVANSCSTMHKIADKEFVLDDFSHEHLIYDNPDELNEYQDELLGVTHYHYLNAMNHTIDALNSARNHYLLAEKKHLEGDSKRIELMKQYWWQMIQLLPSSYNQKRTLDLNYEVLVGIYRERKNHKLDEWREFCEWIKMLPCSALITLEE